MVYGTVSYLLSRLVCLAVRYPAKIIEVDDRDMTVLIHFDGWNQRYDEWVKMTSDQLRPLAETDRVKKEIPHTKSVCITHARTHTHLTVLFRDYPGKPVPES